MDIKTPYLTVDAVAIRDRNTLLVKRKKGAFIGQWALPGGFVERGETLRKAVMREALEETGLRVSPERVVGIYDDPKRDPRFHAASVAFLCSVQGGRIKPQLDEVEEVGFFPVPKIRRLKIAFDHRKIINDALKMQGRKK